MMKHPCPSTLGCSLPPGLMGQLFSSPFCAELPLPLPENFHRAVSNVYLNYYNARDLEWWESGTASPGAPES